MVVEYIGLFCITGLLGMLVVVFLTDKDEDEEV